MDFKRYKSEVLPYMDQSSLLPKILEDIWKQHGEEWLDCVLDEFADRYQGMKEMVAPMKEFHALREWLTMTLRVGIVYQQLSTMKQKVKHANL